VTHVQFNEAKTPGDETLTSLGTDLGHLADILGRDSKVLLDFTGVASFSTASINAIVLFNKKLRTKGSRIALCCLEPTARESFFPAR
jgi:anti-anti-sigma regulatory factor